MKPTIHGDIVIRLHNGEEVHRIPCQYPEGSPEYEKVERGLLRKVDLDTYTVEWEPR